MIHQSGAVVYISDEGDIKSSYRCLCCVRQIYILYCGRLVRIQNAPWYACTDVNLHCILPSECSAAVRSLCYKSECSGFETNS